MHREDLLRDIAQTLNDPLRQTVLNQIAGEIGDGYTYHQVERDAQYIEEELADYVPAWNDGVRRIPLDSKYYCAKRSGIDHFIDHEWGDQREYISNEYDCENYAIRFKALADEHGFNNVGIVIDWSGGHAYNIVVYPGRNDPDIIEPQTDVMADIDITRLYDLEQGLVLI